MKKAITVKTTIEIQIEEQTYSLTISEAKELKRVLDQALGVDDKWHSPYTTPMQPYYPKDDWPIVPTVPTNPTVPNYPQVWCGCGSIHKESSNVDVEARE